MHHQQARSAGRVIRTRGGGPSITRGADLTQL